MANSCTFDCKIFSPNHLLVMMIYIYDDDNVDGDDYMIEGDWMTWQSGGVRACTSLIELISNSSRKSKANRLKEKIQRLLRPITLSFSF